ncbi:MAG: hypothetical protein JST54_09735 [Deltaproteobacteria bacterium]|nr:hypothetical protein [Deltaproteobacteria bacterium]
MHRILVCLALAALVPACGSTTAKPGVDGGHPACTDGGSHCVNTIGSGGTTGGNLVQCHKDSDCSVGVCEPSNDGKSYCIAQCAIDSDCASGEICNARGQCVPRPATSTSTTGTTGTTATTVSTNGPSTTGTSGPSTTTHSTGTSGTTTTSASATTGGQTTGTSATHTTSTSGTSAATSGTTSSLTTGTSGTGATSTSTSSNTGATSGTNTSTTSTSASATTGSGTTTSTAASTTTGGTTGCVSGSCPSGQACDFASGTCVAQYGSGPLGGTCTTQADCASGYCQYFADGTYHCAQTCSGSSECPTSYLCADQGGSGICLDESAFGNFSVGTVGEDQTCTRPSNDTTSQCHSIFYCNASAGQQGICTDSCGSTSECEQTSQSTSDSWICVENGSPRIPYCWFPPTPSAAQCTGASTDCGGVGGACNNGYCDVGNGCVDDTQCRHSLCLKGNRNFCSEPCCSYWNCPGATTCLAVWGDDDGGEVFRACVDEPSNASGYIDDPCNPQNGGNDCFTGYCMAYDAYNPSSTNGYCTSTCCTDADCADSYAGTHCVLEDNLVRDPGGGFTGLMGVCVKQ